MCITVLCKYDIDAFSWKRQRKWLSHMMKTVDDGQNAKEHQDLLTYGRCGLLNRTASR